MCLLYFFFYKTLFQVHSVHMTLYTERRKKIILLRDAVRARQCSDSQPPPATPCARLGQIDYAAVKERIKKKATAFFGARHTP